MTLGKTGIKVSRLFQGTGTNGVGKSSNQIRGLGFDGVVELLRAGVDQGVTIWDLADQYGTHPHANGALKTVSRDKVVIMTKTHAQHREGDVRRPRPLPQGDRHRHARHRAAALHDVGRLAEGEGGAMAVLSEAKQKGIIRAHGVSCHDFGALKAAAASDWVDVDLARLNPAGVIMDAPGRAGPARPRRHEAEGQGHHRDEDPRAPAACATAHRRRAPVRARLARPRLLHDRRREPRSSSETC